MSGTCLFTLRAASCHHNSTSTRNLNANRKLRHSLAAPIPPQLPRPSGTASPHHTATTTAWRCSASTWRTALQLWGAIPTLPSCRHRLVLELGKEVHLFYVLCRSAVDRVGPSSCIEGLLTKPSVAKARKFLLRCAYYLASDASATPAEWIARCNIPLDQESHRAQAAFWASVQAQELPECPSADFDKLFAGATPKLRIVIVQTRV